MELTKLQNNNGIQTLIIPENCALPDNEVFIERVGNGLFILPKSDYIDETNYLLSKPSVARDILEGLSTSWDDCIPESEALA